jgi:bacterioferritin
MQGSERVLEILNEALTAELTAVNQYFIAYKMAEDWGYPRMAKHHYDDSITEMKHAETLIDRILYLDGHPNMQRLFTVRVGESLIEQFRANYELEKAAVERYQRGVAICAEEGDPGTRSLLEEFLREEEGHVDEAETELANYEQLGEALWLAKWATP